MLELTLSEKLVALDSALTAASIPHAFGGAIALAYYAEPRATIDIDCNVFLAPTDHAVVTEALRTLGVESSIDVELLQRDGQVRLQWGRTPIDLFFSYDTLHDAMASATRKVPFGDTTVPILSPEFLVVCKVIFDRRKDWLDIEQAMVAVEGFDVDLVRRWVAHVAGHDDRRLARFDDMAQRLLGR